MTMPKAVEYGDALMITVCRLTSDEVEGILERCDDVPTVSFLADIYQLSYDEVLQDLFEQVEDLFKQVEGTE